MGACNLQFSYDEDLAVLRADLSEETRLRESNVHQLYDAIKNIDVSNQPVITELQSALENLNNTVTNISSTIDFTPYATKAELAEDIADVHSVIDASIASTVELIPDVSNLVNEDTLTAAVSSLSDVVATKTTEGEVAIKSTAS